MPITHGTNTGYTYWKCRCRPCTEAHSAYTFEWARKNADRLRAEVRTCRWCSESFSGRPGGRTCQKCHAEQELERYHRQGGRTEAQKQRTRDKEYQRKYGITIEDYDRMLEAQGGGCAICGGPPNGRGRYHVDHCHTLGKVRGVLCGTCNLAVGRVEKADPAFTQLVLSYIALHAGSF